MKGSSGRKCEMTLDASGAAPETISECTISKAPSHTASETWKRYARNATTQNTATARKNKLDGEPGASKEARPVRGEGWGKPPGEIQVRRPCFYSTRPLSVAGYMEKKSSGEWF